MGSDGRCFLLDYWQMNLTLVHGSRVRSDVIVCNRRDRLADLSGKLGTDTGLWWALLSLLLWIYEAILLTSTRRLSVEWCLFLVGHFTPALSENLAHFAVAEVFVISQSGEDSRPLAFRPQHERICGPFDEAILGID